MYDSLFKNKTGNKYGKLTVLKRLEKRNGDYYWSCLCDCGNKTIVKSGNLVSGGVKSCGCIASRLFLGKKSIKHGMSHTRFNKIWRGILYRCRNPKSTNFKIYGGRGIKCEWKSFKEFKDDMYKSYKSHVKEFGEKNTSVDRIDNDGNYHRQNCKWSTRKEQANNRSNKVFH